MEVMTNEKYNDIIQNKRGKMMKEIIDVKPLDDYKLLLVFKDNEKRIKDMRPYLNKGIFKDLKNKNFFNKVKIEYGTISWDGRIDLCADELYTSSYEVK